jgi:HSP20 family protein
MSNLSVRRHNGETSATPESTNPLRVVRRLLAWDPFREMAPFLPIDEPNFAFSPPFEVKETKDGYEFRADVPGVKEGDIEITVTGNRLTISGKREAETETKNDTYFTTERTYGSFVRAFTLPDSADLDRVRATLDNGVLMISAPRKPETQPKKITVKATPSGDRKS